jgi:alpha-tubulin suppressor-like RCC1 family protein
MSNHSLGIDKNGRAWGWGVNASGRLGNNATTLQCTPVSVCGNTKTFCEISAGNQQSVAIDKDGKLWAWGGASFLQGSIGDGTIVTKRTPVSVYLSDGITRTFCKIATSVHTLVIDKNGRLWAWGLSGNGQLGTGVSIGGCKCTPVSVCGAPKTFCKIAAGSSSSYAIDKYGKLWSWGNSTNGALGNNASSGNVCTPISVCGTTKTFCHISAGVLFACGIDKNGLIWCWGQNDFGQLGDNSTVNKSTPTALGGTSKTFCKISCGWRHTIAVDKNGNAWAWGHNSATTLQIGDKTSLCRCTPVRVCGL